MTRLYADTETTETATFKDNGVLADPTAVTFEYRHQCENAWRSVTPTNPSSGVYNATFTPEYAGILYFRWKGSESPKISTQGSRLVERSAFEFPLTTDYCGCR